MTVAALGMVLMPANAGFCSVFPCGFSFLSLGLLNSKLLCVLRVQSLPAELHSIAADDASNRSSAEIAIQHIQTNVPPGSAHRDKATIDVVPERQARTGTGGFEFPPDILAAPVVLEQRRHLGPPHGGLGDPRRGRAHSGELHRVSHRTQAPIGFKGSPLAQMRWVGKRLPNFFRRVGRCSGENERPFLSVLSYLRPAGGTWCVLLAIDHLLLLVFFFFVGVDCSMWSRWRLRALT